MLFDTHVHLNDDIYENNIEEIIKRALNNGVTKMLVVGYDLKSSLKAVSLANKYSFVFAAVGMHPSEIKKMENTDLEEIEKLLSLEKVIGIGEIGLDYHWDNDNKKEQKKIFVEQIKWSKKYNLPIIIHSRDAASDTLEILKENKSFYDKGIMHCYSYSLEMAKEFIKLNFMLAFGGALTFKNSKQNKEVVENIDAKYLLLETDAPYMTPVPFRGEVNEPGYIYLVAKEMADLKKISEKEIQDITYSNACDFFGLEK